MQTAEKTFAGYTLTVHNRGGHSSKPRKDNAIYSLVHALDKIEAHRFEPMLSETTRAYFTERQKQEHGALGDAMRAWLANPADGAAADVIEADESEVGLTRTRCVPTRLFAGHADNALPQLATAMINCRIFPGIDPNDVQKELTAIVADPEVIVSRNDNFSCVAVLAAASRCDGRLCQGGPHAASRERRFRPKCRRAPAMAVPSGSQVSRSMGPMAHGWWCPSIFAPTARTNGCQ